MSIKAKYYGYADKCVQAACRAVTAEERLVYLEMAQAWRALADKADIVDDLLVKARENNLLPSKDEMN